MRWFLMNFGVNEERGFYPCNMITSNEDSWSDTSGGKFHYYEAADLNLFKKATPFSDKLYEALSHVESREDEEFPIAGPSFNKYFRNPDFCNEEKWTEAAKVLKAVRKDYMEGE